MSKWPKNYLGGPKVWHENFIKVEESQKVVLLGLTSDNRLTFKYHVDMLFSTADYKLHALRR